jgi:hypothetical protein
VVSLRRSWRSEQQPARRKRLERKVLSVRD